MNLSLKKLVFAIALVPLILSCTTTSLLNYQIDPEITQLENLIDNSQLIAIKVVDNRKNQSPISKNMIQGTGNEAEMLQNKLTQQLKLHGYKIINNPLLADVAFKLELLSLELTNEQSFFKSTIKGRSEIRLTVNKKSNSWTNTFRVSRTQDVANPVNQLDATGVMNQMLTKQLSNMFSNKEVKAFISNKNNN